MAVMELSPGRELDALVAEKFLGIKVHRHSGEPCWPDQVDREGWPVPLPRYSTEIADAWKVLNALHEGTAWMPRLLFSGRRRFYEAMSAQCVTAEGYQIAWPDALGFFRAQVPLFICRAALEAVQADEH